MIWVLHLSDICKGYRKKKNNDILKRNPSSNHNKNKYKKYNIDKETFEIDRICMRRDYQYINRRLISI